MKKAAVVAGIVLAIAVMAAGLYVWQSSRAAIEVGLVEVRRARLRAGVSTNGKIEAADAREIRAPFAGACRVVRARNGQDMAPGEHILTIEDPAWASEAAAARAELEAARAELEKARRGPAPEELNQAEAETARLQAELGEARKTHATNEWLLQRSAIARVEADQSRREVERLQRLLDAASLRVRDMRARYTELDLARATARVEAARARMRLIETNQERARVRAPFRGRLYQFDVKEGAWLAAGDRIGLFADQSRLRALAFVDEPELGQVKAGAEVEIRWDAHPQEVWKAKVLRVPTEVILRGSRSVAEVACPIEGPVKELVPNVNVDIEILAAGEQEVPSIPRNALFVEGRESYVWLMRDGLAVRHAVQVGSGTPNLAEIRGGLSVGDQVILPGGVALSEGAKVRAAGR